MAGEFSAPLTDAHGLPGKPGLLDKCRQVPEKRSSCTTCGRDNDSESDQSHEEATGKSGVFASLGCRA